MLKPHEIEPTWTDAARKLLLGKKITGIRYITEKEAEGLGWDRRPIALELDSGIIIFPSQDDEGNGPGALFTTDKTLNTIPVI